MIVSGARSGQADVSDRLSLELAVEKQAAALARQAVADALRELAVAAETQSDILLVTSELVTNAVEHGGGPVRLRLQTDDDRIMLRVADGGSGEPALREAGPLAERNRGLWLVDALASHWDCRELNPGKEVAAEFSR